MVRTRDLVNRRTQLPESLVARLKGHAVGESEKGRLLSILDEHVYTLYGFPMGSRSRSIDSLHFWPYGE